MKRNLRKISNFGFEVCSMIIVFEINFHGLVNHFKQSQYVSLVKTRRSSGTTFQCTNHNHLSVATRQNVCRADVTSFLVYVTGNCLVVNLCSQTMNIPIYE